LDNVVALVCERFGVTMSEVGGRGRHARVVLARAVATHLARKLTSASYPEIARALGRPNHSTVITAYERLKTQLRAGMKADLGDGRGETIVEQVIAELSAELSEDRAARFTYGR
jgi:chromosomal replication initiator protein